MMRRPPRSTLFPSTPRSRRHTCPAVRGLRWPAATLHQSGELLENLGLGERHEEAAGGVDLAERQVGGQLSDRGLLHPHGTDRKSTRLNSSHANISYAVFCLK